MRWLIVALVSLVALPAFAQDLALKRVMLSSGGLGYFEYEATVEGDANLKLTVSLDQVDDVLKSLVVYDDKGGVGGLSLPGKEPLQQTFKDMPFDQAAFQSPADAARRAATAPRSRSAAPRAMSGRIVSVEEETPALDDGKTTTKRTRVALFTDRGLQQFILEDAENLQFADAALRDKIGQALLAIQSNRAKDARTLELSARGKGKRHGARRLYRRGAGVEGVLPADPAGRPERAEGGSAGLGDGRESERPGLEGRRADAGLGPAGRLPSGALRGLLRHAARSAGRGGGPAQCRMSTAAASQWPKPSMSRRPPARSRRRRRRHQQCRCRSRDDRRRQRRWRRPARRPDPGDRCRDAGHRSSSRAR